MNKFKLALMTLLISSTVVPTYGLSLFGKEEVVYVPPTEVELLEGYGINMNTPISVGEFFIAIANTVEEYFHVPMDTHYATPAVQKIGQLEIIIPQQYTEKTWSRIITEKEKTDILINVMNHNILSIEEVADALNNILIKGIMYDGKKIDLKSLMPISYQGRLMVPVRPIAHVLQFDIKWDEEKSIATLTKDNLESKLQVGYDSYCFYETDNVYIINPTSLKIPPKLVKNDLYVPYEYFLLILDGEIENNVLKYWDKGIDRTLYSIADQVTTEEINKEYNKDFPTVRDAEKAAEAAAKAAAEAAESKKNPFGN
ncbi:hypothetical protein AN639_03300 [Candidatus Epulonipiscium fishelsonii]|uniref:Uncharacterized protein n=1 Tax=Candidatus Epulonipiscium fishelsonii TaxID=77094 RepID=A0ACC8XH46_9FIRM|nr:hypothetical protein AN639_03300 [Epulopiscium sp. SCG-B05WGA-EpuloA1]ONI42643.1 hypothetical protein AN396_13755 [Epulopiscium sp. SCG-B11WGA-EpuloA1]